MPDVVGVWAIGIDPKERSRRYMFGLIGHSTSFEAARRKALELGFDHIADGDLDVVQCSPQLVEHVEVTSPAGTTISGIHDSCFVPEMLSRSRRRGARCRTRWSWPGGGHQHHRSGWFHTIIFENRPAPAPDSAQYDPGLGAVHREHPRHG